MPFDHFSEEKTRHQRIIQAMAGQEEHFIKLFLEEGPVLLRQKLHLQEESDWKVFFDHLIFKHNLVAICVLRFKEFFINLVQENGPQELRKVLGIVEPTYDQIFEKIFDFICISTGAILDYVGLNREKFLEEIRNGKGENIRENLRLQGSKYDHTWQLILDRLFVNFEQDLISERLLDQSMQSFAYLMNTLRVPRSLREKYNA